MAIDLLKTAEEKPKQGILRLRKAPPTLSVFLVSLIVLIALGFVGLLGFNFVFNIRVENLKKDIGETRVGAQETSQIQDAKDRLESLKFLIANHRRLTNIFEFLQDSTQPKVRFSQINVSDSTMTLSGETDSFLSLARQLAVFENKELSKYVNSADLSGIGIGAQGKASFNFRLDLDKNLFIK